MTYTDFVKLVSRMRNAQRAYFYARKHDDLKTSKKLEKQVDDAIKGIVPQKKLFDE